MIVNLIEDNYDGEISYVVVDDRTKNSIGRIVLDNRLHTWSARDGAGLHKADGFRTREEAVEHLIIVFQRLAQ